MAPISVWGAAVDEGKELKAEYDCETYSAELRQEF